MKIKFATSCFILSTLLIPAVGYSADSDADRAHPKAFVKDSVITTKIKAKLAEEKLSSLLHIKVDTDKDGMVWLSGTARTKADVDKAYAIARETKGVASVKNDIQIKQDD